MATRFYLPSSGGAAASPAFDAAWNVTSSAVRLATVTTKTGTPNQVKPCGPNANPNENCLAVQYVSSPLSPQTVSGTVKGQIGGREAVATTDAMPQIVVRVVSGNGTVVRGTLIAAHSEVLSSEYSTSYTNRKFPLAALSPVTVTNVDAQDGDRIVIEVGSRVTGGVSPATALRVHDDAATDMPEDETTAAGSNNPWIEFSANLAFQAAPSAGIPSETLGLGLGLLSRI